MAEALKRLEARPGLAKDDVLAISERARERFTHLQFRLKALGHYLGAPLPLRSEHLWRYSDPTRFFPAGSLIDVEKIDPRTQTAVETEGNYIGLYSDRAPEIQLDEMTRSAVQVEPLSASKPGSALIGKAVSVDHGIFEALNGAIWSQGIFIRVKPGAALDRPIRILRAAASKTAATRVVIRVEQGANAAFLEIHEGGGADTSVLAVSELFLEQDAMATHAVFQEWRKGTVGHFTSRALLERNAHLVTGLSSLGGSRYKADVGAVLNDVGASSRIVGVSLADKRRHIDLHTVHDHRGPRTQSRIVCKTALFDRSTATYTGLIRMAETAELSEALQENRSLLLSDRCRSDAIPELEIETNEVQCSHAATASPIDEGQLFYLKSRGIPEGEAIGILVHGFFEDALGIVEGDLKNEIVDAVSERLAARYPRRAS